MRAKPFLGKSFLTEVAFTPALGHRGEANAYHEILCALYGAEPEYAERDRPARNVIYTFNEQLSFILNLIEINSPQAIVDRRNMSYFREEILSRGYDRQGPGFYAVIKRNLEIIACSLIDEKIPDPQKKSAMKDFFSGITACGPGVYMHIQHAAEKLQTNDSIFSWLASFRKMIIFQLAEAHIAQKDIRAGLSIHVHNVLLAEAKKQGWAPLGYEALEELNEIYANNAGIGALERVWFCKEFLRLYTPDAIMTELVQRYHELITSRMKNNIASLTEANDVYSRHFFSWFFEWLPNWGKEKKQKPQKPLCLELQALSQLEQDILHDVPLVGEDGWIHTFFDALEEDNEKHQDIDDTGLMDSRGIRVDFSFGTFRLRMPSDLMPRLLNHLLRQGIQLFKTLECQDKKNSDIRYCFVGGAPALCYGYHQSENTTFRLDNPERSLRIALSAPERDIAVKMACSVFTFDERVDMLESAETMPALTALYALTDMTGYACFLKEKFLSLLMGKPSIDRPAFFSLLKEHGEHLFDHFDAFSVATLMIDLHEATAALPGRRHFRRFFACHGSDTMSHAKTWKNLAAYAHTRIMAASEEHDPRIFLDDDKISDFMSLYSRSLPRRPLAAFFSRATRPVEQYQAVRMRRLPEVARLD